MAGNRASHFDNIVIGAGSTGAVVAARLASWTDRRVLLLEAGPDYYGRVMPKELDDARTPALGSHDWGLKAVGAGGHERWLPRGKVVGGSSAVNSCIALRPPPSDFDRWPAGRIDWTWSAVRDSFIAIEADADYTTDGHGRDGPVRVARTPVARMTRVSAAFYDACLRAGFDAVPDLNFGVRSGVGPLPLNVDAANRRISATAFLDPVRARPNLTVMPNALVDAVVFEGRRAVGVDVVASGRLLRIGGDDVLLAAGALGTPAILLRSGIGPAADLRAIGIDVVADLPAVGLNLADHAQVPLVLTPASGTVETEAPCAEVILRYGAPGSDVDDDMQLCLLNHVELSKYAPHLADGAATEHAFVITANLMHPDSRGSVRLATRDPARPPVIHLDHVAGSRDRARLREGLRLAHRIATDRRFRGNVESMLGADDLRLENDASVDRYVAREVQTAHHPTGTAAMGTSPTTAVVDTECKVFGVSGLRVADASIVPYPVRANTNLTCMMIGERVARLMAGTAGGRRGEGVRGQARSD